MEAVVFKGKCCVAVERVPVPTLEEPSDAIVRIDLCGLCGSDMHPYHCREEGLDVGTVMGHEFVGHVVSTGGSNPPPPLSQEEILGDWAMPAIAQVPPGSHTQAALLSSQRLRALRAPAPAGVTPAE